MAAELARAQQQREELAARLAQIGSSTPRGGVTPRELADVRTQLAAIKSTAGSLTANVDARQSQAEAAVRALEEQLEREATEQPQLVRQS
eukprot:1189942-Prorocentrum_minimum.AAC.4